jgi:linoleoyl-CoA desaturase
MPAVAVSPSTIMPATKVRFGRESGFHSDLKARVDAYFEQTGRSERDVPAMYLKTAMILAWFAGSWALMVFSGPSLGLGLVYAISLGLAVAGIGMSVQHDANHGGYSRHAWVNSVMGWTLDAAGASSFVWRTKHNAIHHTFTNVDGQDDDLDIGLLARWTEEQSHRPWHRFQHLYTWALYGFLLPKWVFLDDFRNIASRRIGRHKLAQPTRMQWATLLAGKAAFVTWALIVPMFFLPVSWVVLFFFVMCFTVGVTLSITFQLAHCVEEADFPSPGADGRLPTDWAEHQLYTTVDFAMGNPLLTWYMGGLNFQVEHHLFPRVCHLHYPALARIVEATALAHGLKYRATPTLHQAVASHYSLLKRLGRTPLVAVPA